MQRIVLKKLGGVPVLQFLQRLALDFPYVCLWFSRDFLPDKCIEILKSGSRSFSACNALKFFQENPYEWSFSLHIIIFSEQPFYGNYSTLDSHTITVISYAFAYSSRWRRKQWQGLIVEESTVRIYRCINRCISFRFTSAIKFPGVHVSYQTKSNKISNEPNRTLCNERVRLSNEIEHRTFAWVRCPNEIELSNAHDLNLTMIVVSRLWQLKNEIPV